MMEEKDKRKYAGDLIIRKKIGDHSKQKQALKK